MQDYLKILLYNSLIEQRRRSNDVAVFRIDDKTAADHAVRLAHDRHNRIRNALINGGKIGKTPLVFCFRDTIARVILLGFICLYFPNTAEANACKERKQDEYRYNFFEFHCTLSSCIVAIVYGISILLRSDTKLR